MHPIYREPYYEPEPERLSMPLCFAVVIAAALATWVALVAVVVLTVG